MSTGFRLVALLALTALGAVAIVLAVGGGEKANQFSAVVPAAANLVPGQEIKAGGRTVGGVTAVEPAQRGRAARIRMRIADPEYWPLPRDTRMEIRFGGTVSFSTRYLLLLRGSDSATIPEGGELAAGAVKVPVEVDTVVSYFPEPVREDFQGLIGNSAAVLDASSADLHRALAKTPAVTHGASDLLADLTTDRQRLASLLTSTTRVTHAIDRAQPGLRDLLSNFATTVDAIAYEADDLKLALARFPRGLRQARSTLQRADITLREAGVLTDRLAPSVAQLRLTVNPLRQVMAQLRQTTPKAVNLLKRESDVEDVAELVDDAHDLAPRVESLGRQATRALDCLRPWTPEIAQFGTVWGDWISQVDSRDHLVRARIEHFLPLQYNAQSDTPGQLADKHDGLRYGFPHPPGAAAGQPWFQPQCAAGREAIDPDEDPEARNFGNGDNPPPPGDPVQP